MRKNLSLGLEEISPHFDQDTPIYILAGGPSLADYEDEIIELGKSGALFVTCNGTYKWLIDRGIRPAMQSMVDAREFNKRFVEPIIDTCWYLFSSQAANEAVSATPREQTILMHSGDNDVVKAVFEEIHKETGEEKKWFPVYGGSTVVNRTLVALAMLGYRKITVFGWDSCLRGDQHHPYSQPENDSPHVVDIKVGNRHFQCHPWMVIQANEVPKLIRYILAGIEGFELDVRGDGLIAHILNHAANLAAEQEI
jgi:hypothetical protein